MSFNPYTWDSTKERVDSEVLFLDLKDNKSELLEVSSLPDDIVIVIPSKPRTMPKELWYFTTDDDLRFHEITVKYENTLIQVEVKPQEPTVHLFVYLRFGQRPTTQNYDLNATISQNGQCVWTASAHDKKERQPECSSNPPTPIATLARHPGKYFLGVKNYNATTTTPHRRKKRSCFTAGRQKRSCVEVKDPPPTLPMSKTASVTPAYDSKTDQNYTLRVTFGSCVYWSAKVEMWVTKGCRVSRCKVLTLSNNFYNVELVQTLFREFVGSRNCGKMSAQNFVEPVCSLPS